MGVRMRLWFKAGAACFAIVGLVRAEYGGPGAMSGRRSFIDRLLNRLPPLPQTRLTRAEAIALAAVDSEVVAFGRALPMATVHRRIDGRLVWRVTSATIGMLCGSRSMTRQAQSVSRTRPGNIDRD